MDAMTQNIAVVSGIGVALLVIKEMAVFAKVILSKNGKLSHYQHSPPCEALKDMGDSVKVLNKDFHDHCTKSAEVDVEVRSTLARVDERTQFIYDELRNGIGFKKK